ncbi:MAG: ankyrin repeat domain-containing protein [Proteobacteria bacterium]|nr:ankyrin repeat domain-containing protein [Pseudomonadota bacterium]
MQTKQDTALIVFLQLNSESSRRLAMEFIADDKNRKDIAKPGVGGLTPLHWAVKQSQPYIVKQLMAKLSEREKQELDDAGLSAVHIAVSLHNNDMVKVLLDGKIKLSAIERRICLLPLVSFKCPTENDETALISFSSNNFLLINSLVQNGANVNGKDKTTGCTIFHNIVKALPMRSTELLESLLKAGADFQIKDDEGDCPIHIAAREGHASIMEFLANKVDVNIKGPNGQTALHIAAAKGFKTVIELLLTNGANIDALDSNGKKPLALAKDEETKLLLAAGGADYDGVTNQALFDYLLRAIKERNTALVGLMLEKRKFLRGQLNEEDADGTTPLMHAIKSSTVELPNEDVINVLIKYGALVNHANKTKEEPIITGGVTPILWAAGQGVPSTIKLLVEKGAKLDFRDARGASVLHYANWNNSAANLECLLSYAEVKALVNSTSKAGTPLQRLVREGWAVKLLLENGADVNLACTEEEVGKDSIYTQGPIALALGPARDEEAIKLLLAQPNIKLNLKYSDKAPLCHILSYAANKDDTALINRAVADGVKDIDFTEQDTKFTPFYYAIAYTDATKTGSVAAAQLLLEKGANIRKKVKGKSYLYWAVEEGNLPAVQLILTRLLLKEVIADPYSETKTELLVVAFNSNNEEVFLELLRAGFDTNGIKISCTKSAEKVVVGQAGDKDALYIAVCKGWAAVVRELILQGAAVSDALLKETENYAIQKVIRDRIEILDKIEKSLNLQWDVLGAAKDIKTSDILSPSEKNQHCQKFLRSAVSQGNQLAVRILLGLDEKWQVTDRALEKNINFWAPYKSGDNIIHVALFAGGDILWMLIKRYKDDQEYAWQQTLAQVQQIAANTKVLSTPTNTASSNSSMSSSSSSSASVSDDSERSKEIRETKAALLDVQQELNKRFPPIYDAEDNEGRTPLNAAAIRDVPLCKIQVLLEAGADPTIAYARTLPVQHYAAHGSDIEVMRQLLQATTMRSDGKYNITNLQLLFHAACNRNYAIIRWLLKQPEIDVFEKNENGLTLMQRICSMTPRVDEAHSVAVFKLLLSPDKEWARSRTLRENAVEQLTALSDPKSSEPGVSALHMLARGEDYAAVLLLQISNLGIDVDYNMPDAKGRTMLHHAIMNIGEDSPWFVIDALKTPGADLDAKDSCGYTPLQYSIIYDCQKAFTMLFANPLVDKKVQDEQGRGLLHLAAEHNRAGIVCQLMSAGFNLLETDATGKLPIVLTSSTSDEGAQVRVAFSQAVWQLRRLEARKIVGFSTLLSVICSTAMIAFDVYLNSLPEMAVKEIVVVAGDMALTFLPALTAAFILHERHQQHTRANTVEKDLHIDRLANTMPWLVPLSCAAAMTMALLLRTQIQEALPAQVAGWTICILVPVSIIDAVCYSRTSARIGANWSGL